MTISSAIISRVILKSIGGTSTEDLIERLFLFLKNNHLSYLLPKIIEYLEREQREYVRKNTTLITTSHQFDEKFIETIIERIGIKKNQKYQTQIDSSILGGFVVKGENLILDASIKRNLESLKELLLK